jgi:hypothetical protein
VLQRYKEKGIERARLFSVNDDYYRERGWQDDVESNLEKVLLITCIYKKKVSLILTVTHQ